MAKRVREPQPGLTAHIEWWRFVLFGRVVPGVLFGLVGYLQLLRVSASIAAIDRNPGPLYLLERVVPDLLYFAFCALPVGIYIIRPRPKARDGRLVARATAFFGTLVLLGVNALPGNNIINPPGWIAVVADLGLVAAYGLAVWGLLYLRKSFSIIPEARRVVSGGPYRIIRHPLYAAEMLAGLSFVLTRPALAPMLAYPLFVIAQLIRSVFEERLLTATFPAYAEYRSRTWRLVPFLF